MTQQAAARPYHSPAELASTDRAAVPPQKLGNGTMMAMIVPVADLDDPALADYRNVPDPALLAERGVFVAEGRLVVRRLLTGGRFRVRSLLVTEAARASLDDVLAAVPLTVPIYVASKTLMSTLIGFNVHRGCLAIGERSGDLTVDEVLSAERGSSLVVALEQVANADNVGGIFRNAAAFGVDAVLLSPGCCDPLYRKAIRVSIGGTLSVPFARCASWPDDLARLGARGFALLALTPGGEAVDIDTEPTPWKTGRHLAVLAGAEGSGLTAEALALADHRVRIPMVPGANSLNVATAVGIALHRFSDRVR
jgi:tRNA G18 (ribose-2'-O)-methylase SpoU